jgi:CRISPR/Cas system-associated exonuclease Cas4 (RecB family)
MNYEFNEKQHIHLLDGKPLMGVTTVLSVISKPALIQWSANMAVGHIKDNIKPNIDGGYDYAELLTCLDEAKSAHRKKKETAGDWGTFVHKAIEEWIKEKKIPTEFKEHTQLQAFENFVNWATQNKVEFLESEKHLWSKELWIGGIVDLVIKMDGKKYIADIKTSSGIYNEAFFQMGAYNLCLEEMGDHKDVEGYLVINLKKDGKMDLKMAHDMEINKKAFKHALGLYQIINSIK